MRRSACLIAGRGVFSFPTPAAAAFGLSARTGSPGPHTGERGATVTTLPFGVDPDLPAWPARKHTGPLVSGFTSGPEGTAMATGI